MDYHIALRTDDDMSVLQQIIRVCRTTMCLNQRYRTYPKSIMMEILIMLHQRQYDLPTWRMFKSSCAVFNEEVGEMSFAQLGRCVLGRRHDRLCMSVHSFAGIRHARAPK